MQFPICEYFYGIICVSEREFVHASAGQSEDMERCGYSGRGGRAHARSRLARQRRGRRALPAGGRGDSCPHFGRAVELDLSDRAPGGWSGCERSAAHTAAEAAARSLRVSWLDHKACTYRRFVVPVIEPRQRRPMNGHEGEPRCPFMKNASVSRFWSGPTVNASKEPFLDRGKS
jgi:hypothetical protein